MGLTYISTVQSPVQTNKKKRAASGVNGFTFPSGKKIPKTTNKTAGHTPFHRSGQVQRHLNYSGTGN